MRFTLYIHKSFSGKLAPTSDHEGVGGIHCQPPLRKISAPKREVVTAPPSKGGGRRRLEAGRRRTEVEAGSFECFSTGEETCYIVNLFENMVLFINSNICRYSYSN